MSNQEKFVTKFNSQEEFVTKFDNLYVTRRAAQEVELGRGLYSSEIALLRAALRDELRLRFPEEVAAIEYYNSRNLEYTRNTGRPFPAHAEMNGDTRWFAGATIEQRLRALTISRSNKGRKVRRSSKAATEKTEKHNQMIDSRLGNVRSRYVNMVKKYGYVPSDELTMILSGITLRMAGELRASLESDFELVSHQHEGEMPDNFRPYWIARPKEDTTAKLVNVIQGLGEDDRKALIELLASIK